MTHGRKKEDSENISGHVKKVQEELEKTKSNRAHSTNSIKQLELFTEWADGAQEVDPNEGVISELWQKLLIEIANGNSPDKDLIEKLKTINFEEAKLLLKIGKKGAIISRSEKDLHYLESLESNGLVKPINIIPITILVLGVWSFLMFMAVSFTEIFGDYGLVRKSSNKYFN